MSYNLQNLTDKDAAAVYRTSFLKDLINAKETDDNYKWIMAYNKHYLTLDSENDQYRLMSNYYILKDDFNCDCVNFEVQKIVRDQLSSDEQISYTN